MQLYNISLLESTSLATWSVTSFTNVVFRNMLDGGKFRLQTIQTGAVIYMKYRLLFSRVSCCLPILETGQIITGMARFTITVVLKVRVCVYKLT